MSDYCYVIINNAGHSWPALSQGEAEAPKEAKGALPALLADGWVPVRETPMGGGTSSVAHSLVLLERKPKEKPARGAGRRSSAGG
jgi:hypothetical protein